MGKPYHGYYDSQIGLGMGTELQMFPDLTKAKQITIRERTLSYMFRVHFHPYVSNLVKRLLEEQIPGLQSIDTEYVTNPDGSFVTLPNGKPKPVLYGKLFTPSKYDPSPMVEKPYPVKDIDFTSGGAYSVYNWELFFHVPLTIAMHLSKNGRFEDAMRWFHFIFDPTDDTDGTTPERFWKAYRLAEKNDSPKVEIGFGIGQILSVKLTESELSDLRKAVESDKGWYDLKTAEGSVALNLATVVFLRVNDATHSIGFSG